MASYSIEFSKVETVEGAVVYVQANFRAGFLASIGLIRTVYCVSRAIGKILGGNIGAKISGASKPTQRWIGPVLLPQAGVAVGMALAAGAKFPEYHQILLSLIISTTILFEIIGPVLACYSLNRVAQTSGTEAE